MVGESDFAGRSVCSASDDGNVAGGVMWGTKRAAKLWRRGVLERVDFGDRNRFFRCGVWQEVRGNASKEGLARSWGTGQKEIMVTSDRDSESAFGERLAFNIVEKGRREGCSSWLWFGDGDL